MSRNPSHVRTTVATALALVLVLAVAALAGAAPGKPGKPGKGGVSAAQYQYGPSGKQYGKTKVTLCHKGKKTITVGAPAAKAHMRHGDKLGSC